MLLNPDLVTVAVTDAGAAIDFFELLGFTKGHVATIDGGTPAEYMGMPDMKAQHITLALDVSDPRFEIQLLVFDPEPDSDPGEHPTNKRRRGYNHLASRVDDIAAVTDHLVAHGVRMLSTRWTTSAASSGSSRDRRGSPSSWWSGSTRRRVDPAAQAAACVCASARRFTLPRSLRTATVWPPPVMTSRR